MKIMLLVLFTILSFHSAFAQALKEPKSCDCFDVFENINLLLDDLSSKCANADEHLENILKKCEATWKKNGSDIATELLSVKLAISTLCNCVTRKDWKGASLPEMKHCAEGGASEAFKIAITKYGKACLKLQKKK
jgi:hypothetical protein